MNQTPEIKLIVGLGNIGQEYASTRHNIGFDILNTLFLELKAQMQPPDDDYFLAAVETGGRVLKMVWPTRFMNRSGSAVKSILKRFGLAPSEMIVLVDDFNLPLGKIRLRSAGSGGGHNGLLSIIEAIETENFPRLRAGIGPLPENSDIVEFVLDSFGESQTQQAQKMVDTAAKAVIFATQNRFEEAMTKYNINPA